MIYHKSQISEGDNFTLDNTLYGNFKCQLINPNGNIYILKMYNKPTIDIICNKVDIGIFRGRIITLVFNDKTFKIQGINYFEGKNNIIFYFWAY